MSIRSAVIDGVATLEIARPEKRNALSVEMYAALAQGLEQASQDPRVRAVLITGQPGVFTAGNDLEDFVARPPLGPDSPVLRFMRALLMCPLPVVAAVTGPAVGIGTTLLLHCDLVYLSDEAYLSMPFTALGLVAEFASSALVPERMGSVKAAEKLLLGDPITASEAVEWGLANAVLPAGEVLAHARRVAERFNRLPKGAVRDTKALMRQPHQARLWGVIEQEAQVFAQRTRSPEAREAFRAFFEKRDPDFSNIQD